MRLSGGDKLQIPAIHGCPVNEYRIRDGAVEFRSVGTQIKSNEGWRQLTPGEIQLHFALDTIVAKWLVKRLGGVPYAADA